jgi:hypothetical protein
VIVRVYLYHLDPDALAVPALLRDTLHRESTEERVGEREILVRTPAPAPAATLSLAIAELDRLAPHWRDLADVRRVG